MYYPCKRHFYFVVVLQNANLILTAKSIDLYEVPNLEEAIADYLKTDEDKSSVLKKVVSDRNIIKLLSLHYLNEPINVLPGKIYLSNLPYKMRREGVRGCIKDKSRDIYLNYNLIDSETMSRTLIHEVGHLYAKLHDREYYHGKKTVKHTSLVRPYPEQFFSYSNKKQQSLSLDNADSFAYFIYDLTGTSQYRSVSTYEKFVDGLSFFCTKRNAIIATASAYILSKSIMSL